MKVYTKDELQAEIKRAMVKYGAEVDLNYIDTSKITNMNRLFWNSNFNGNISRWNVSQVTDMAHMFSNARAFNQDISKWNTRKVKSMAGMFWDAVAFNQNLSKWKVSNVQNMSHMFYNALAFNQDLSKWKVSEAKKKPASMSFMFFDSGMSTLPAWYKK